jgi:hypothetical protein
MFLLFTTYLHGRALAAEPAIYADILLPAGVFLCLLGEVLQRAAPSQHSASTQAPR